MMAFRIFLRMTLNKPGDSCFWREVLVYVQHNDISSTAQLTSAQPAPSGVLAARPLADAQGQPGVPSCKLSGGVDRMGLQDKPSCKKSSLRGGWRQEGALAGLRTGSLGSSGSGPTQWGPGEPHPTASRCREEAEWSSGTASRGDGLSVPLPALLELDRLGMGESNPDGVGYHLQGPLKTWGQHGSPHTGQGKEGQ